MTIRRLGYVLRSRNTRVKVRAFLIRSSRRLEVSAAAAVAILGLWLGSAGLIHLEKDVGRTFAGFLWGVSHHGGLISDRSRDGGFVITYTPSSWPALNGRLRWNDAFVSADGRPIIDFQEVLGGKMPGEGITYRFFENNQWQGETYEVVLPAEEFTLDKLIESAGVYYLASLVFLACGLTLVALPTQRGSRLSTMAGWLLIVAGVYELSGLRSTYAVSMGSISILGDLTWHFSFAAAGAILILLASELSLGETWRRRARHFTPVLLLVSAGCAFYGLAYLVVDYGLGEWWLAELLYAAVGGIVLILAAVRAVWNLRHRASHHAFDRDYRGLVSLPFVVGAVLIFIFAVFPEMLGARTLLPTQTLVPLVTMLPIGLLYSVMAARWLEDRDDATRIAESEASRAQAAALANEVAILRYRSEVGRFKGVLHNDILGSLQSLVYELNEDSELRKGRLGGVDLLGERLHSLVRRIREEALTRLNAEQPMGDDFPSLDDVEKLVSECLNTNEAEIRIDKSLYSCSEEVRKLLYVHLHTMLLNSAQHGRATVIKVEMMRRDEMAVLSVEDNGTGFDSAVLLEARPASSAGLREAIEVARACGGQITVESFPNRGTRIVEELPAFV